MYSLFEIRKVLSISKPGGGKGVNILLSSYSETKERSILALVCDNGYILFRFISTSLSQPVIRQLCWFHSTEKLIKSLSFDSSGFWLLIVTADASVYIVPVLSLLKSDFKVPTFWKNDNLTEIKLSGRRAPLTSVQWWETHQGQHIAIIGSELGEISFINLQNKKEVGGTYITTGISALNILYDESHDTTYLLITGNNQQQWRLLLEEKKSNFYWPFTSEIEITTFSSDTPISEKPLALDDKSNEQRPHRLSKFESGTFLTPQSGGGRNLVSAYNSSSCLLQVLEGDLDQMHLFSYKVPSNCENIILSDKLIFTTLKNHSANNEQQYVLKIISRKFSEISAENSKKKEAQNAEIQKFIFSEKVLAMYKLIIKLKKENNSDISSQFKNILFNSKTSQNLDDKNEQKEVLQTNIDIIPNISLSNEKKDLEGCILVQKDCVWECRLRIPPEELFLSLTSFTSDLPLAEKLGVMLGLDLHKLYEIAADTQLSNGQFAQAVHLYQLSKCPQLKRVAHFMGYGYLSELIAYIQVLFSTKGVEIVSADKCHFANIALHCFAHQVKEKLHEKQAINIAFKKFLKENSYYDEEVAAKLLTEQGLYDLLYYFAKIHGQQGLMVETLLSAGTIKNTVNTETHDALLASGYEVILHHTNNDDYIRCMTSFHLLQFIAAKPSLLSQHLQHIIMLLPQMDESLLRRVAFLYDPSRPAAKLAFRNIATSKINKRYWSMSSLANLSNEAFEMNQKKEHLTSEEDMIKFFIFVLLMLCHKMKCSKFDKSLIFSESFLNSNMKVSSPLPSSKIDAEVLMLNPVNLACGQAHVAYIHNGIVYTWGKSANGRLGTEDEGADYQSPQPVLMLYRLQVKVLSVACGALHTLALTDCGLFGWGSSRFGQLGVENVQQSSQPILIEHLLSEHIVSICCGQYHSLALTSDGSVYTWGWGIHGQLGHGNAEDSHLPRIVKMLKKKYIVSLSAGQGHSVVLSKDNKVYTFGCGMFGQLGTGSVLKQSYPQLVDIPEDISIIASGYFHVLAISKTNKIYTWGCNPQALRLQAQTSRRARQHNVSKSPNHVSSQFSNSSVSQRSIQNNSVLQQTHLLPNIIFIDSLTDEISEVACGSHHSVLITKSGDIFAWGRNSEGQIGNGTRKEQKVPNLIGTLADKKIIHVTCGADFTIAIDSAGKLLGWGQNDNGQIGQKPSPEINTKAASNSASGRVITIRTNRRMITITQPCRQNILRPTEIIVPYGEKIEDLDIGSFENEHSILKLMDHKILNKGRIEFIPKLSKLDIPPFGLNALHATLKAFHPFCDISSLLNHCLGFSNFQAAAKLCMLEKLYDQAIEYQLKATSCISLSSAEHLSLILHIIELYTRLLDYDNDDMNRMFLYKILKFWVKNKLPIFSLESFLINHQDIFSYPLCLILLNIGIASHQESEVQENFLRILSTKFCLAVITNVINQLNDNSPHIHLLEEMMLLTDTKQIFHYIYSTDNLTTWNDSIPVEHLWIDIIHNLQKGIISHSSMQLTSSDIDILSKSLLNNKFYEFNYPTTKKKFTPITNDAVIFSCGHHYTKQVFQTNILPMFKDSMQALSYSLPQTIKFLLSDYQAEVITAACPKCVATEIRSEI